MFAILYYKSVEKRMRLALLRHLCAYIRFFVRHPKEDFNLAKKTTTKKYAFSWATVKKAWKSACAACERVSEAVYRFDYLLGAQVIRLVRRNWRRVYVASAPQRKQMQLLWRRLVWRPARRVKRAWKYLLSGFPTAREELQVAAKRGFFALFPCLWDLLKRAAWRHRDHAKKLWVIVGPATALVAMIITLTAWTNTDFCLELTYRGQELGYIDSATVYTEAAGMATDRVVNVDNSFSVEAAPKLAIAIKGNRATLDDADLCDAILRTAGDSIAEATGLYVDGKFVGSMESTAEMESVFASIKDGFYDKNDTTQRAEFVQQVKTVEGLFPSASVTDKETLRAKLVSEAVVKKTYIVQPGDTLSTIAVRNNMTTTELRAMNPSFASTDMVHIGDELLVQRPQPFLQVKVIKTLKYSETIDYNTVYKNNTDKPVTYNVVKVNGQEGSQDVVAEATYIDGVETERKVISKTVTKQPVTKVVERGTQPVVNQSGSQVQVGDGISKGQMSWPVPICSNMSRGWRAGHYALDICNGPVTVRNKPCIAADGGTVVYAGWNGAYGYYVKIQHKNGLATAYAHLNSISVVKGQTVSRNQQVGLIGSTGRSSGPHLHFEVLKNGVRVNPLNYVTRGKIYW